MNTKTRHLELLAPAGDMNKLKVALMYGADAVYIGGTQYGLRANAGNFTLQSIKEACEYAHERGRKVYVTMNIVARNGDIDGARRFAAEIEPLGVDGVIVSDPGMLLAVRECAPSLPLHMSTQSSTMNYASCAFWHNMGAAQINLARETTLEEIAEISGKMQAEFGCNAPILEAFVHGAMCMSYSGRCMLSDFLSGRSSNHGDCSQPCRWKYFLTEEKRPGEYMPIYQDDAGTFIFNSKDLCMLEYLPQMVEAGVTSFKIEGRMKSEYYTAVTVRAYRIALDTIISGQNYSQELVLELIDEVKSVSHRQYSTGFYLGGRGEQVYSESSYVRGGDFVGIVTECVRAGEAYSVNISQRGVFESGDELEFVIPGRDIAKYTVSDMKNAAGDLISRAPHAMMDVQIMVPFEVTPGVIVRRKRK